MLTRICQWIVMKGAPLVAPLEAERIDAARRQFARAGLSIAEANEALQKAVAPSVHQAILKELRELRADLRDRDLRSSRSLP